MRLLRGTNGHIVVLSLLTACSSSTGDDQNNGGGGGNSGSGPIFNVGGGDSGVPNIDADGGLDALRHMACAGQTARTEPLPAVLMLVVDTSGSMSDQAPGGGGSKWTITRDALKSAIDSLPASTGLGVLYFPDMNTSASTPNGTATDPPRPVSACVNQGGLVPLDLLGPPGAAHRTQVMSSLDNVNGPQGGTPTDDAYKTAIDPVKNTTLPGNKFLVLITDGQPTFLAGCIGTGNVTDAVDPRPIIDDVTAAKAGGVSTFVIGSPGSEQVGVPIFADARTWLSMAAQAGGTATPGCDNNGPNFCHFDMSQQTNFADALRATLATIVGTVVSCEYPLPVPPNNQQLDLNKVNVVFTPKGGPPQLISQAPAGSACTQGWQYSSDHQHLDLCSDTCNRIKADSDPTVDVWFGCTTQTAPVH